MSSATSCPAPSSAPKMHWSDAQASGPKRAARLRTSATSSDLGSAATALAASGYNRPMLSKLAQEARRTLVAETQRLTPEQRLEAFLAHSRLLTELYLAGQKLRDLRPPRRAG